MGNSSSDGRSRANDSKSQQHSANKTHHHHLLDLFHLHHNHFFNRTSAKQPDVEPEVESFFRWWNEQNGQQANSQSKVLPTTSFNKIMAYFSQSTVIKMLIQRHISAGASDKDMEIDQIKLKVLFNYLYEAFIHSGSNLLELYTDLLFVEPGLEPSHPNKESNKNVKMTHQDIREIVHDCYAFTLQCALSKQEYNSSELKESIDNVHSDSTLKAILNTIEFDKELLANEKNELKQVSRISKEKFRDWLTFEFPNMFNGFQYWFIKQIKDKSQANVVSPNQVSLRESNEPATSIVKKQQLSNIMNNAVVWYLASNLSSVYLKNLASDSGSIVEKIGNAILENRWKLLYSSETHGLSINRFLSSLFNYKAPTIMLVMCESGSLYCVCSNEEYKESPTPYGDSLTKAFRFWPDFKTFDVDEKNIYLNTKSKSILKLGLIYGYNLLKPVLKIDEHFQSVEHYLDVEQEEDGVMVKKSIRKSDKIYQVEVYGCGSTKAAQEQENMKKWESKQIEKMRTAKLNAEWGENADKTILDLAGIQTEHSQRGDI